METLTLDSSGGAALVGAVGNADGGRRLTLDNPHLRALDIHGDRQLEAIDLSGCRADVCLHLQLSELPVLRHLYLPAGSEGAVVHLFALTLPPTLVIHGAVTEIDADWQAGTFSVRAGKDTGVWRGARLLGQDALPDDLTPGAEAEGDLAVVMNPAVLPGELALLSQTEWLIANAERVTQCTVKGSPRVRLDNATRLEALVLNGHGTVEVRRAGVLAQAEAVPAEPAQAAEDEQESAGGRLVLHGNTPALALTGCWGGVQLHAPALERLTLEQADRLSLYHCRDLEDVVLPDDQEVGCYGSVPAPLLDRARFVIDEATLSQTLTRVEGGEDDLLEGLLEVMARSETPHAVFHSLTSLRRLAEKGVDPARLWECRRTLSARQCRSSRKRRQPALSLAHYQHADARWHWKLPDDRQDEGLRDDLQLWALCVPHSEDARRYGVTLRKAVYAKKGYLDQEKLVQVLRLATAESARPAIAGLALEILTKLYGKDTWPGVELKREHEGIAGYLPRLLNVPDISAAQRQAVLCATLEMTTGEDLAHRAGQLLRLAPGQTRALLMTLSRQPDEWLQRYLTADDGELVLPLFFSRRVNPETVKRIQGVRQTLVQLALMPPPAEHAAHAAHA
ncbi:hypothetical protein GCM10022228_11450 [Halomonas cibimaris]|uniref:Uncharacterized protein n=1 Tax=Halomonas cibimaris TaxID=657012 RepID=A0ABP7LNA1_9GAMM